MRKTLAIVLSIIMVLSLGSVSIMAADATEIKTAEEFAAMAADGNYKLAADITVDATYSTAFTGTFDGNGHTVTVSVPMFKQVDGTLKNFTVKGAVTNNAAGNTAAVVLETAGGTFENITNEASVINSYVLKVATTNETVRTGGIIARIKTAAAKITGCVNKAEISGAETTGGIAGESQTTGTVFTDCVNYGKITTPISKNSGTAAGGIVGYSGTASVEYVNCVNYGEIISVYRSGGITGDSRKAAVCTGCVNYGKITGENAAGGIIGYDGDKDTTTVTVVTGCVNFGEVSDTNQAGGLVGYVYGSAKKTCLDMQNCINNGKVNAGKYGSEFIGYTNSWNTSLKNCIGVGELASIAVEGFPTRFCITGCSSTMVTSMVMENVYIADKGATEWYTWAAFTTDDANAKNRIPLSACLGKDLAGVEYEYTTYASADYTAPSGTAKIVVNDDISAKDGETVVGTRVKAITRIELNEKTLSDFAAASGLEVHLENGNVLFGAPVAPVDPPVTGDSIIWVAVVALVSVLGMGIAIKSKN